jgi:hypothetical protein
MGVLLAKGITTAMMKMRRKRANMRRARYLLLGRGSLRLHLEKVAKLCEVKLVVPKRILVNPLGNPEARFHQQPPPSILQPNRTLKKRKMKMRRKN